MLLIQLCKKAFLLLMIVVFPIISFAEDNSGLIGGKIVLPSCCPDSTEYIFVHIIRDQRCTECSVGTLYQWNDVISMIGRRDISYFFIVEMLSEDTPDVIQSALSRRPFSEPMFIDYSHEFINNNSWLSKKQNQSSNDFLLDRTGRIIGLGNPLEDFHFMRYMKDL